METNLIPKRDTICHYNVAGASSTCFLRSCHGKNPYVPHGRASCNFTSIEGSVELSREISKLSNFFPMYPDWDRPFGAQNGKSIC